jgi:hypothetical protein
MGSKELMSKYVLGGMAFHFRENTGLPSACGVA